MHDSVQVNAEIPRRLKRRVFAAFALREEKFNRWLCAQMEAWLAQVEGQKHVVGPPEAQEASHVPAE